MTDSSEWTSGQWVWIRRPDQSLSAYRFYQRSARPGHGEFYVGSQLQTFPLSWIVGPAEPPGFQSAADNDNDNDNDAT